MRDAIPGYVNVLRIEAAAPGLYVRQCAEFSGRGYRNHVFSVQAHNAASWETFLKGGATMTDPSGAPLRGKALPLHRALAWIWGSDLSPGGWHTTSNNNDNGTLFLIVTTSFIIIGGIFAMLIRAQLATPNSDFMEPQVNNQIFTVRGTKVIFLFASPFFEVMSMLLLPEMLRTGDMSFPRLGACCGSSVSLQSLWSAG